MTAARQRGDEGLGPGEGAINDLASAPDEDQRHRRRSGARSGRLRIEPDPCGVTDNWGGNYGDVAKPPSGDPTFDGMYHDFEPQYHNPPSNQYLNGGAAPTFNYHRFWAEADVAAAFDTFAMLFPNTSPPAGF